MCADDKMFDEMRLSDVVDVRNDTPRDVWSVSELRNIGFGSELLHSLHIDSKRWRDSNVSRNPDLSNYVPEIRDDGDVLHIVLLARLIDVLRSNAHRPPKMRTCLQYVKSCEDAHFFFRSALTSSEMSDALSTQNSNADLNCALNGMHRLMCARSID